MHFHSKSGTVRQMERKWASKQREFFFFVPYRKHMEITYKAVILNEIVHKLSPRCIRGAPIRVCHLLLFSASILCASPMRCMFCFEIPWLSTLNKEKLLRFLRCWNKQRRRRRRKKMRRFVLLYWQATNWNRYKKNRFNLQFNSLFSRNEFWSLVALYSLGYFFIYTMLITASCDFGNKKRCVVVYAATVWAGTIFIFHHSLLVRSNQAQIIIFFTIVNYDSIAYNLQTSASIFNTRYHVYLSIFFFDKTEPREKEECVCDNALAKIKEGKISCDANIYCRPVPSLLAWCIAAAKCNDSLVLTLSLKMPHFH